MFVWTENRFHAGNTGVFYRACLPRRAVGHIIFNHGYAEHSGRYRHFMEYFAARGYAVYAPDHRGHGFTARHLGDLESFDLVVEDLAAFKRYVHDEYGAREVFIVGHSLGGSLALCMSGRHPESIGGVVLLSPLTLVPSHVPPALVKLARVLSIVCPRLPVLRLAGENVFRGQEKACGGRRDPLVYSGRMQPRTAFEMLNGMQALREILPGFRLPLLVIHPGRDRMNPLSASELVMREAVSPDKSLAVFENSCHALLHDEEKDKVFDHVHRWLERRNPVRAAAVPAGSTAADAPAGSFAVTPSI